MSRETVILPNDLCAAEFQRQALEVIDARRDQIDNGLRLTVVADNCALDVGSYTSHVSVFPCTWDGSNAYRGDTARRGHQGVVIWSQLFKRAAENNHAMSVVCGRARRMAQ